MNAKLISLKKESQINLKAFRNSFTLGHLLSTVGYGVIKLGLVATVSKISLGLALPLAYKYFFKDKNK